MKVLTASQMREVDRRTIELGIPVKSHASVMTNDQTDRLRAKLGGGRKPKGGMN